MNCVFIFIFVNNFIQNDSLWNVERQLDAFSHAIIHTFNLTFFAIFF
jgi:hypothetical protein